ncbi:MAG: ABC transporter ATP-binding protein [Planctomycetes bacterium]|nr:ABC transporter ATP-binding protein [Planctomycetota bacterium]
MSALWLRSGELPIFEFRDLTCVQGAGLRAVTVFESVDFRAPCSGILGIHGPSGAGKSTLLNLLAGLATPSSGSLTVLGSCLTRRPEALLQHHRRRVGYVLQSHNLIEHLSARDNVALPLRMHGMARAAAHARADAALAWVGLTERAHHRPCELSGGEQQRVAIARALAQGARLLLADEPTSALDAHNAHQVLDAFREAHQQGIAVVIVSHDHAVLDRCDHLVNCDHGRLVLSEGAGSARSLGSASLSPLATRDW